MYKRFFGLRHSPFSIAPDPRYLFMSERHREALAHLLFGLNGGGGFVLLTGEIGAGKTTVCRLFLEQIPARCNVAYIFNPKQTVTELLQSICDEFGVPVPPHGNAPLTVKELLDPLNTYLLATHAVHQNNVLIIDEAQNLSADVLEQLRLLTNLETSERKLLQIILIGQPELRAMLARPELEQLAQRVIARFHLDALSAQETEQYVAHRLAVAGYKGASPFSRRALKLIHQRARGVPRRINLLCDRSMLGAYASGTRGVNAAMIRQAGREVFDFTATPEHQSLGRWRAAALGLLASLMILAVWTIALQRSARSVSVITATKGGAKEGIKAGTKENMKARANSGARSVALAAPPALANSVGTLPTARAIAGRGVNGASQAALAALPITLGTDTRSLPIAYRRLGAMWHLTLPEGDACTEAAKQNLYCFSSTRGLSEIRELDRPGILVLHDDEHHNYYALLLGLSSQRALLQIGETTETVDLAALARRWEGEFTTLWRGPAGYRGLIGAGDHGVQVNWLASRLATAAGTPAATLSTTFDDNLLARLREFQLTHGLRPDGRAGPQTCMRLNALTRADEPHLQTLAAVSEPSLLAAGARK